MTTPGLSDNNTLTALPPLPTGRTTFFFLRNFTLSQADVNNTWAYSECH